MHIMSSTVQNNTGTEYHNKRAADSECPLLLGGHRLMNEKYLEILYNIPMGFELTAGMTTNYQQLKTIYQQRRHHRLPDWQMICDWIETLPRFMELTQKEN